MWCDPCQLFSLTPFHDGLLAVCERARFRPMFDFVLGLTSASGSSHGSLSFKPQPTAEEPSLTILFKTAPILYLFYYFVLFMAH